MEFANELILSVRTTMRKENARIVIRGILSLPDNVLLSHQKILIVEKWATKSVSSAMIITLLTNKVSAKKSMFSASLPIRMVNAQIATQAMLLFKVTV